MNREINTYNLTIYIEREREHKITQRENKEEKLMHINNKLVIIIK